MKVPSSEVVILIVIIKQGQSEKNNNKSFRRGLDTFTAKLEILFYCFVCDRNTNCHYYFLLSFYLARNNTVCILYNLCGAGMDTMEKLLDNALFPQQ